MKDINKGLVLDKYMFATYRDRALYIRTPLRNRVQWLKDNPTKWRLLSDVEEELTATQRLAENKSRSSARAASSNPLSLNEKSDEKENHEAASVDTAPGERPTPRPSPALVPSSTVAAVNTPDIDEIAIGTRRYVTAKRLASIHGFSAKTLSRRCKDDPDIPKIRINNMYYELNPASARLAERRTSTKR
jgi:hypothetical protein